MQLDRPIFGLPIPRMALIGRERELAEIHAIAQRPDSRLLTLTGVGGCGKTRLSLQIAADLAPAFPQRTWVVELAAITSAELVPIVVATTLGLLEIDATTPVTTLTAWLASRPALLVLDNCEHLIDACATLVDTLLASCPELRIIATSREPLQLAGELQYRVPPLATPDPAALLTVDSVAAAPAVQLFVTRAHAVSPAFLLTAANATTIARICSRLGGIPLALELAAARVPVLGVEQILARLDDSFRLLAGGRRVAPTRHQTLKATLDWSEALLTESERTVFRRLAVFAGEFQLEAAEAVCSDGDVPADTVLDAVAGLVNKSLVMVVSDDRAAWYHLLEPVRQYALARLHERGELARTSTQHAAFYLELAERAAVALRGAGQEAWLARLDREHGNLRAALEWAQARHEDTFALRLAVALVPFWEIHGHLTEGLRWLRALLASTATASPSVLRARALAGAGRLAFAFDHTLTSPYTEAEELTTASLNLARALGDESAIATALADLGMIHRLQGDVTRSIACLQDALDRHRALGDEHGVMFTLMNLASTTMMQGDGEKGTRLLVDSLERARALGDLRYAAIAQVGMGRSAQDQKAFAPAIQLMLEAMTTHLRLGDRWFVSFDLFALADVLIDAGYPRHGVRVMSAAEALSDRLGSHVGGLSFAGLHTKVDILRQEDWFENAWNEGYALEPDDVVREAQERQDKARARDCLEPIDNPAPSPLTRREVEVARLLTMGYTDRQIADALFLSVGTVGVHVHHILQKLELRSRVEVAGRLESRQRHVGASG